MAKKRRRRRWKRTAGPMLDVRMIMERESELQVDVHHLCMIIQMTIGTR
jgi:hypothetical protein